MNRCVANSCQAQRITHQLEVLSKQWGCRALHRGVPLCWDPHSTQTAAQCGPRLGSPYLLCQGSSAGSLAQTYRELGESQEGAGPHPHPALGRTSSAWKSTFASAVTYGRVRLDCHCTHTHSCAVWSYIGILAILGTAAKSAQLEPQLSGVTSNPCHCCQGISVRSAAEWGHKQKGLASQHSKLCTCRKP